MKYIKHLDLPCLLRAASFHHNAPTSHSVRSYTVPPFTVWNNVTVQSRSVPTFQKNLIASSPHISNEDTLLHTRTIIVTTMKTSHLTQIL